MSSWLPEVALQRVNEDAELVIVHIPNIANNNSVSAPPGSWSELLPELVKGNARVLQFQHEISLEDPFSWSHLLNKGITLLDTLFRHQLFKDDFIRPLVFITEGLAGLILKNALVIASRQPGRYRSLLASVVGLILIGVPHVKGTGEDTLQRLTTLLRPGLNRVSKKLLPKDEVSRLEIVSEKFREVDVTLQKGLISGYETQKTSLAGGTFSIRKSVAVLVDKEFARIDWPGDKEQLLPIDIHLQTVLHPRQQSQFRPDLAQYMDNVTETASALLKQIQEEQRPQSIQIPSRPTASIPPRLSSTDASPSSQSATNAPTPTLGRSTSSPRTSSTPSMLSSRRRLPSNGQSLSPPTVPSLLGSSSESDSSFDIIPEAAHFEKPDHVVPLPCYMTRPHTKNKRFWPQEGAIRAIEDALLPLHCLDEPAVVPTSRTFVLYGMGGVGKTEIATEFVFKHQQKFEAIFFLHAEDRTRLSSEFVHIATVLGLEDGKNADRAEQVVKEWFAQPARKINKRRRSDAPYDLVGPHMKAAELVKWLIVFDNADDPEMLLDFWPEEAHGSILVTSRDPLAMNDELYFGKNGLELREFSDENAAAFLRSMTGNENITGAEEASSAIASRLGGLPLAIEQVGAIIKRQGLSLEGFLKIYKDDADFERLQDQRFGRKRGYQHSIASVWALQSLPTESRKLLDLLSFLSADSIPKRLLMENLSSISLDHYPKTLVAFTAALNRLIQCSIVSVTADGAELRIHRLVQDVVRSSLRSSNRLESTFDAVVDLVWTDFPRITRGGVGRAQKIDRWSLCDELFPHISRLREFYAAYPVSIGSFQSQRRLADLLNEAAWYQHERANPTDTTPCVELAQSICEESVEDYTEQLALIFGTRTWSCALMKERELVLHYAKERLELEEKLFAKSGRVTANLASAYNDLAAAYSMNGLSSKAFPLVERSKQLRESMPMFKPEHNFSPLHELSLAYWHQKDYGKASDCLLQALRERVAAVGENDRQSVRTGQLFYALGNVKASQGKLQESAMWHQKALIHYRNTGGESHFRTACACYRVAEHCVRDRQLDTARDCLDQAIDVFQNRWYYRQEYSRTCFLYHELHKLENNEAEANAMLQKSVEAFNLAFPETQTDAEDLDAEDFVSLCVYDF